MDSKAFVELSMVLQTGHETGMVYNCQGAAVHTQGTQGAYDLSTWG